MLINFKTICFYTFFITLFFATQLLAQTNQKKWEPFLDFEGKAGSKRHLGEADLFIPLLQNEHTLFFTDIRYRIDNQSSREGNFGLGVRHILPSHWIVGGYSYYDRRRSTYDNYFSQITLGVEALSVDWDFRANAYIPIGKKSHLEESLSRVDFSGTSIMYSQGEERSLKGYDVEVGYRLPLFKPQENQQVRIYAGGFRFYEEGVKSVEGPRARADLTFDDIPFLWEGAKVTFGAELQRDAVRGSQSFATLRVRIPLGKIKKKVMPQKELTLIEKRMTTPIVRDVDIVSQSGVFEAPKAITADGSGKSIEFIKSDSISAANFKSTIENAGENSTVVLSGTFSGINSITTLKEGQSIIGNGSMTITTPAGQKVTVPTPGVTIAGRGGYTSLTGTNTFFVMGNNSSLIGITAHNTDTSSSGTSIVHMKDVNNVTIKNNTLSVTASQNAAYLITVDSSSNLYIGNNTLSMHNNGTYGSLIGFIQNGSSMNNITFENNTYEVSGTANKSRTFFFNGATVNNLSGSNNTTTQAAGSMGTYKNASIVSGSVSFTNGFIVQ